MAQKPATDPPKRGEIWVASGGKDYAGIPRPVVILQDNGFAATDSVTICPMTTDATEAPLFRLPVAPNPRNGLREASRLMADKITTMPRSKLGGRIGQLDETDIHRLNRALIVFLGLAASPRASATSGASPDATRPPAPPADPA